MAKSNKNEKIGRRNVFTADLWLAKFPRLILHNFSGRFSVATLAIGGG